MTCFETFYFWGKYSTFDFGPEGSVEEDRKRVYKTRRTNNTNDNT